MSLILHMWGACVYLYALLMLTVCMYFVSMKPSTVGHGVPAVSGK